MGHLISYVELDWIPQPVAEVWRVLLWGVLLSLLGSIAFFLPRALRERNTSALQPAWTVWLYAGVSITVLRDAVVIAERWGRPLALEVEPMMTLAALVWLYSRFLRRGRFW